jgi:hypothetical protein
MIRIVNRQERVVAHGRAGYEPKDGVVAHGRAGYEPKDGIIT